MIPLGSCTMKLNATTEMMPVTLARVRRASTRSRRAEQAAGLRATVRPTSRRGSREITGFAAVSLQPNAGSQGEYAGLLAIRAYHVSRGDAHRDVCLIPRVGARHEPGQRGDGRHAGRRRRARTPDGNVDLADLRAKAERTPTSSRR